ncbi:MAG: diguanylate cyclase [Micromonosporaceae bacterium]|nr:diguanylate cyclase [Micromonosporaceae bacterium]
MRRLLNAGHASQACALAAQIAAESTDPTEITEALLRRLAALLNLNLHDELAEAVDEAFNAIRGNPDPAKVGAFHALAAVVAHLDGSLERCVTHMVRSSRALGVAEEADEEVASAWHNLAISYSYIGFHGQALATMDQARRIAAAARLPTERYLLPEIRVRLAVSLDHRGDTDGCVRVLRDVVAVLSRQLATPDAYRRMPVCDRAYFGYGAARLAVLGHEPGVDISELLKSDGSEKISQALHELADVCRAIQEGRPADALCRLETLRCPDEQTFGAAEIPRLRALAHLARGDGAAAHAADREAFALTATAADRLRELFVDGVAARIDHEDLRRTVARYADEALTDPLTGLPNRRHLEQYTETMARAGEVGAVGVLDLDEFKAVNTMHGHLSGDLVLQRVAGILTRVMRRADFVARFGGDEFVLVLPGTSLEEAAEVGNRVVAAIATEDWDVLVPNTPVSITVGWAELDGRTELASSFESADRAMLRAKQAARAG